MSDDPKTESPPPVGAPPGTMPIPPELSESPTHRDSKTKDPIDQPSGSIDWGSLAPHSLGEVVLDVVKLAVFSIAIMNAWAVAHGCQVTSNIEIGGLVGGLLATIGWKTFVAIADAFGARVVGATYTVLGIVACVVVLKYAASSDSAATSKQVQKVIQLLGVAFLYPAALGLVTALKGDDAAVAGFNPLGFPLNPRWFSTLWILFAKEMRAFFTTSVPFIIILAFTSLNGYLFWLLVEYYTQPGSGELPKPGDILASNIFTLLSNWLVWPAITMRLIAEEKRQGTIETLLTVPVTDVQVIFSKYLAAFVFFVINLIPFLGYHFVLAQYARDWDWGPVFAEFLGMFLWASMALAIGLFYSTLTDSQLVAFILSAFTNVSLYLVSAAEGFLKEDTKILFVNLKSVVHYLAVTTHYNQFVKGIISTQDVVYFVSITALALFASVRGLEAQRWK